MCGNKMEFGDSRNSPLDAYKDGLREAEVGQEASPQCKKAITEGRRTVFISSRKNTHGPIQ